MLIGIILRGYKTYQTLTYIPISNGTSFSAFVGENGVGKSSVLEALDSFFNSTEWNVHHILLSKGPKEREPVICPIFLLSKDSLKDLSDNWLLDNLSKILWEAKPSEFNASVRSHAESFCNHRDSLISEGFSHENSYLVPVGHIKYNLQSPPSHEFSIFESTNSFTTLKKYAQYDGLKNQLYAEVTKRYKYIYIPSEIDYKEYTRIEGTTIQALLGQKLDEIVREFIKPTMITEINRKLSEFLDQISSTLQEYQYKKPARKQNLVNRSHITEKVIEAYFESKVLNKKFGKDTIPVNSLSSGEKRKALIDIAKAFLTSANQSADTQIILAIDEPEMSLHVSSAFKQFENLKNISKNGTQVIVTTHWYGFMPIVSSGLAIYCTRGTNSPKALDLRCFREEIRNLTKDSSGALPIELELKGTTDLIHSIVSSMTKSDYRWVICEGSADKIYLDHYLDGAKVNVIAVGGSPTVKRIYNYMETALSEAKVDVKGKAFFLVDTDKAFEQYAAKNSVKEIKIMRIKNDIRDAKTKLLLTSDNQAYPPTVIEDTLPSKPFIETLEQLGKYGEHAQKIKEIDLSAATLSDSIPSGLALNLRANDQVAMEQLFNSTGFKVKFALEFVKIAPKNLRPSWIEEILKFLYK
jgi:predicted ATP-dependent endonuclease of OLD family